MSEVDVLVIGAGVVGLACAASLAKSGFSVVVLERQAKTGQETSSRNSGVIHAGIYYPEGSLKARLCVRGRQLLYERCQNNRIRHQKIGKLIVASDETETDALLELQGRAQRNDVELELLDRRRTTELEPLLDVAAALWSPESGIVDAHELNYDYQREAKEFGAFVVTNTSVVGLDRNSKDWTVRFLSARNATEERTSARWVINAGGLHAERIAILSGCDVASRKLQLHWCKGDYFSLSSRFVGKVNHLVYPLPQRAGLGIHLTRDASGALLAGPDAKYVTELNYDVDPRKAERFARAVARYLPGVTRADLSPAYAGIRPKLQGPNDSFRDFVIEEDQEQPNLVQLMGIESPGLTASPAIAERVVDIVRGR